MLKRLFTRSQTSILSAAFVIASMYAASRILGLIRYRLLNAHFTPAELDPFNAAFRIPNFLFEILILGSLTVGFIPVIASYLSKREKKQAFYVTSSVINIATVLVFVFVIIFGIFTSPISKAIAPGLEADQHQQMVLFTRIILIFQVFPLVIGNFLIGLLQTYKRFLVPALAPVVYNVGIIAGIVFLTPHFGLMGAIYGVVVGAVLFLVIQIPLVKHIGYSHKPIFDMKHKGVVQIGKLIIPRTVSVASTQVDATVDLALASLTGAGSITVFNYAQQLQYLPVTLFAIPIAQAAFPTLSEYYAKNNTTKFKKSILTSLHQILFFVVPASAYVIIMKIPLVRLVYGADQFDWNATVLTSNIVAAFAVSLFAQALVVLFARAFFAMQDSITPVIIAIVSTTLNTILSLIFIVWLNLPVWALGISTSTSAVIHAFMLFIALDNKINRFDFKMLIIPIIKIFLASAIMAVALYVPLELFDELIFDTTRVLSLLLLTFTTSCIGLATYMFFAWFFKIDEVLLFYKFAQKLTHVKDILLETPTEVVDEKRN